VTDVTKTRLTKTAELWALALLGDARDPRPNWRGNDRGEDWTDWRHELLGDLQTLLALLEAAGP
jgi:hypothetical protein